MSFSAELARDSFMTLWQNYCSQKEELAQLKGTLSLAEEGLANYAQENKWLRGILSEWQFDVGGASERLEQKTLAALNGVPEPQPDKP